MPTYLGWNVVALPTTPPAPASIEFARNDIAGAITNPFTAQQQIYDWQAGWWEASVSYAEMTKANAQAWVTFLRDLKGMNGVFQFSATLCAQFTQELTTDGTTPRYFRLKQNQTKWHVRPGIFYAVTFEIREAL